jgi:hypothetical protein
VGNRGGCSSFRLLFPGKTIDKGERKQVQFSHPVGSGTRRLCLLRMDSAFTRDSEKVSYRTRVTSAA